MFLKKLLLFSSSAAEQASLFYLNAKFAEGLDSEALRTDGRVRTHVGERVLSSSSWRHGPLQEPRQEGPHQVLRLVGQLRMTRDVGDGHHDVLSDDLQQRISLISVRLLSNY